MESTYHILNGDALLEQLPDSIEGERLVCRECLVDGDVQGDTLEELYATRAKFIGTHYPGETEEGYYAEAVPELNKIAAIPAGSNVYLWFEDDLFCQVNLWFVASMLPDEVEVFLVRPEGDLLCFYGRHQKRQALIKFARCGHHYLVAPMLVINPKGAHGKHFGVG